MPPDLHLLITMKSSEPHPRQSILSYSTWAKAGAGPTARSAPRQGEEALVRFYSFLDGLTGLLRGVA
jgi:hypothetical protein